MFRQLKTSTDNQWLAPPDEPVVLCAADDNYVKPLAVTLRSAAVNLAPDSWLHVVLMDGGISTSNFTGLRETLLDLPISISVIKINPRELKDLGTSHHITHTAYFRLLAGRLLPRSIEKVIYLDSDVLVKADLNELWNFTLGDRYCLAATDIACPFIDAYQAADQNPKLKKSIPYFASVSPVANWQDLAMDGTANYFNSGVMVLNLRRWREDSIHEKLLACLRNNAAYVWCWDQYALNVVFAGQWGQLPIRWNQGAHVYEYPDESFSPIAQADFLELRDNPAVVHYTTEFKPWKYEPFHPFRDRFFEALDETAWSGWRPEKPPFQLQRWWDRRAVNTIKYWTIQYRRWKIGTGR